jgi:hypothetical protein
MDTLLFSLRPRHATEAGPFFRFALCFSWLSCRLLQPAQNGPCDMRKFGSLLRSAPSRIGRRLALIVAIAAASLPAAGA